MTDFNSLSIKKLKHILLAKSLEVDSKIASTMKNTVSTAVEKESLISLCNQYIDPSDIERLTNATLYNNSPPTTAALKNPSATAQPIPKMDDMKQRAEQLSSQSPDQLKYQAACMRRDPNSIRRSSPEYAQLSDAQIFQMADQMEQLANNPEMLKQVSEQMKNMTPEQYEVMKKMHQSQTSSSTQQPGSNNMLDDQLEGFIKSMRENPAYARSFVRSQPGMSHLTDAEIDEQLNVMKQLDPATLTKLLKFVQYIQQKTIPLQDLYAKTNRATGGKAKYIVIVIVVVVTLLVLKASWMGISALFAWYRGSSSTLVNPVSDFAASADSIKYQSSKSEPPGDEFDF